METFSIVIYSTIAGLSTIVGMYLVKSLGDWTRRNSLYLISFAIGVLLANSFLHLIPEALELNANWYYWVFLGIGILYVIENYLMIHTCQEEGCETHNLGVMSAIGIGFHSLIDGIIIGIGFEVSTTIGVLTSLAVIFHEVPEGAFTYTLLVHDHMKERSAVIYSWIVALATPVGALLTLLFIRNLSEEAIGTGLALAAGTFLYIALSDLLPQSHRSPNIKNLLLVALGVVFVIILSTVLE